MCYWFAFFLLALALSLSVPAFRAILHWQSESESTRKCVNMETERVEKSVVNTIIALSHINTNVIFCIYVCLYINSVRVNVCVCVCWYERRKWQWKPSNFHRVNAASTSLDAGNMLRTEFIIISHTYHKRHFNDIQCSCFAFSGLDYAVLLRWVRRRVCRFVFFYSACAQWHFGHWISCLIEITSIRIKRVHGMNLRAIASLFCLVSPHFECQVCVAFVWVWKCFRLKCRTSMGKKLQSIKSFSTFEMLLLYLSLAHFICPKFKSVPFLACFHHATPYRMQFTNRMAKGTEEERKINLLLNTYIVCLPFHSMLSFSSAATGWEFQHAQ